MERKITAVVWDFDGTLVDTRRKNLNVTRALVQLIREVSADTVPALRSLANYERALQRHYDWKQFYRQELGLTADEVLDAGNHWAEFQRTDTTAAHSYPGVPEVVAALSPVPQGIVSLNSQPNIVRFLQQLGLAGHFGEVIGYEQFEPPRHKPAPDPLVACIDRLTGLRPGSVMYIGDHESDVLCARNTRDLFAREGIAIRVLSIGAVYAPLVDDSAWSVKPDFRADEPEQILGYVSGLPTAD